MSLNPYEPPQISSAASDKDLSTSNQLSAAPPRFRRGVTLAIGLLFAPCLALVTTVLTFALVIWIGGQASFPGGAIALLNILATLCLPVVAGFLTLKQVAGWLNAPEWWEMASVALWIVLSVALVVGYAFSPR